VTAGPTVSEDCVEPTEPGSAQLAFVPSVVRKLPACAAIEGRTACAAASWVIAPVPPFTKGTTIEPAYVPLKVDVPVKVGALILGVLIVGLVRVLFVNVCVAVGSEEMTPPEKVMPVPPENNASIAALMVAQVTL
jgi:hypothetical protein